MTVPPVTEDDHRLASVIDTHDRHVEDQQRAEREREHWPVEHQFSSLPAPTLVVGSVGLGCDADHAADRSLITGRKGRNAPAGRSGKTSALAGSAPSAPHRIPAPAGTNVEAA